MLVKNVTLLVATMMMSLFADQISGNVDRLSAEKQCVSVEGIKVFAGDAAITGKKGKALSFPDIKEGSAVKISGMLNADGKFAATTIEVVKKVKKAIVEGTVTEVNTIVKYIMVHGVRIQAADGGDITNDLGHSLVLEMIKPGAQVYCQGSWEDNHLFYAKLIRQDVAAPVTKAAPVAVQLPAAVPSLEVVEESPEM